VIFEGITHTDPDLFRFTVRLRMHHLVDNYTQINWAMVDAFNRFGQSMQKVAESMRKLLPYLGEVNGRTNLVL